MVPSLSTLFLPLENGDVASEGPALFLGAAWHPMLPKLEADLWQPFRPLAQELENQGLRPQKVLSSGKSYKLALVHLSKQVEEAKYSLATALENLAENGTLLAAAANDAGGSRISSWLKELGIESQSLSKNKARAVWARRPKVFSPLLDAWKAAGVQRLENFGDGLILNTMPGLFSWNKIDPGSKLLSEHLPNSLTGTGADFGSGIGYLSYQVLSNVPKVKTLHMIEADARALACAELNLKDLQSERTFHGHWADLSKPVPSLPPLDFVIMNPPFHTGKKTESSLGQDFIRNAAYHLRKGGILMMVANTHLPYESIVKDHFNRLEIVIQKDGYKIFKAIK